MQALHQMLIGAANGRIVDLRSGLDSSGIPSGYPEQNASAATCLSWERPSVYAGFQYPGMAEGPALHEVQALPLP